MGCSGWKHLQHVQMAERAGRVTCIPCRLRKRKLSEQTKANKERAVSTLVTENGSLGEIVARQAAELRLTNGQLWRSEAQRLSILTAQQQVEMELLHQVDSTSAASLEDRIAELERVKAAAVGNEDHEPAASLTKQIEFLKAGGQPTKPFESSNAHHNPAPFNTHQTHLSNCDPMSAPIASVTNSRLQDGAPSTGGPIQPPPIGPIQFLNATNSDVWASIGGASAHWLASNVFIKTSNTAPNQSLVAPIQAQPALGEVVAPQAAELRLTNGQHWRSEAQRLSILTAQQQVEMELLHQVDSTTAASLEVDSVVSNEMLPPAMCVEPNTFDVAIPQELRQVQTGSAHQVWADSALDSPSWPELLSGPSTGAGQGTGQYMTAFPSPYIESSVSNNEECSSMDNAGSGTQWERSWPLTHDYLVLAMLGVLLPAWSAAVGRDWVGGDWQSAPRMFSWSDQIEARGVVEARIRASPSGNDGNLQHLLSLYCLLGAALCWCLPVCAKDWLRKLELETNTISSIRRTWMRFYFFYLLPLFQIGCAFHSSRDSGSIQTVICRLLGFTFIAVAFFLLFQTDENFLRTRRAWLVTFWVFRLGYQWDALNTSEDLLWLKIARWHLCSTVVHTSLVDHLQESFFILAVVLAASPAGFSKVVGITVASTVTLCAKLRWYQLHPVNRPSIRGDLDHSNNVHHSGPVHVWERLS